jgi:hypothetical protein
MAVDPKLIAPLLVTIVAVVMVLRRVRRSFGPQLVRTGRLQFRIGVLGLIGVLMIVVSIRNVELLGALIGGIGCGAALGYLGLRHSKFEVTAQGRYYTPHTYIGLLVSALFIGRLLYRTLTVYPAVQAAGYSNQDTLDAYHKSPLTLAILGVLIGYYVLFSLGVLRKS